jgi:hypothetical protein
MFNQVTEEDYVLFFETTVNIFEDSYKAISDSDYYGFLYHASVKFLRHVNTAEALMHGSTWRLQQEARYDYFDQSSILALLRTTYENLVTTTYLFFEGEQPSRLKLYQYCGYKNRHKQKIKVTVPELQDKVNNEKLLIQSLEHDLIDLGVTKKHMKDWKPTNWYDLGVECKLPRFLCNNYKHWSSHSNTGFDSLMQVNSSEGNTPAFEKRRTSINYLFLCATLAFFIKNYVEVLSKLGYSGVDAYDLSEVERFLSYCSIIDSYDE